MKIYLASMFSTIKDIKAKADTLRSFYGIDVTSRWLEEKADPNCSVKDFSDAEHILCAKTDMEDIMDSSVLVLFSVDGDTPTKRGGRHWETGYAYGLGKKVIICGPKENIFHFLPDVEVVADFEALKKRLMELSFEESKRNRRGVPTTNQYYTTFHNSNGGILG